MTRKPVTPGMNATHMLDAIDWKILEELQTDGSITNVELSRRVGISAPPCLRRVRNLEEAGFVQGFRALLDEKMIGYDITMFAMVGLSSQNDADVKKFVDRIMKAPLVRECYMLSGEIDFMLKCVAPNLRTFQSFIMDELVKMPEVGSVKSALTIGTVKSEGIVPFDFVAEKV